MRIFMFRVLIMLIGIFGVWIFFLPFLNRRVLNIGNATGLVLFGGVFLYGFFFRGVNQFFQLWFKAGGLRKATVLTFFVGSIAIFSLAIFLSVKMYLGAGVKSAPGATAVVLGCKVYGTRPSLMLRERLAAAYTYLTLYPDASCILSGGQGEGEEISEAEAMFLYLKEKGIAEERLFLEDRSTNTRENLAFSYEIIKEKGLNDELAIITNEFHEYRAGRIARNLGLSAGSFYGETAWWLFPTFVVREMYSILYEWVR